MKADARNPIWEDDLLNREEDAHFLIRFLTNRIEERAARGKSKSYVLNVDAAWGYGKSFFLKRLQEQIESEGHPVAFVNAWEDDHAEDPLLSVMAAIDAATKPIVQNSKKQRERWELVKRGTGRVAATVAKGALRHLGRKMIGEAADEVEKQLFRQGDTTENSAVTAVENALAGEFDQALDDYTNKLLADFREGQNSIKNFRQRLKDFVEGISEADRKPPLFVLIDELDRCRPLYAIELLERVKHIFETDNLVFIIATDTDQLRHSVRAIYGNDFDSERYLTRFFDRSYEFEEPLISEFVRLQCEDHGLTDLTTLSLPPKIALEVYLTGCFGYFGLSLRDVDQCMDIFRSVVSAWDHPHLQIQVCALIPLIVAFQQRKLSSTNDATLSALEELHSEGRGRKAEWLFSINVRDAFELKKEYFSGANLTHEMLLKAESSLPKIMEYSEDNVWRDWIRMQFKKEFEEIHDNSYSIESPPFSILTQYPDFIRSASRLLHKTFGEK